MNFASWNINGGSSIILFSFFSMKEKKIRRVPFLCGEKDKKIFKRKKKTEKQTKKEVVATENQV